MEIKFDTPRGFYTLRLPLECFSKENIEISELYRDVVTKISKGEVSGVAFPNTKDANGEYEYGLEFTSTLPPIISYPNITRVESVGDMFVGTSGEIKEELS